jgi:predicted nucleotidyltransferase
MVQATGKPRWGVVSMGGASNKRIPDVIADHRAELEALCREYGVERLEVFGSATSGRFNPETSDLDFLVEYKDDFDLGPWMRDLFRFQEALEELFGRSVDLVFASGIRNPFLRRSIDESRMLLYAA